MSRVASFYDKTVAEVYERYQRRLIGSNAVDFDDILMLTVEALERFPDALRHWQHTFRYILVDEYQDTNHAQYRLLQLLAAEHKNVFAVGDPDQCLVEGTLVTMADGSLRPIEDVRRGRRGALVPRKWDVRSRTRHERPPLASTGRHRDYDDVRAGDRVDPGAHAFRRLQDRVDAAAAHDLSDVEARRRLQSRNVADVHRRPDGCASGPVASDERGARGCHVGRLDPRDGCGGAGGRDAPLACATAFRCCRSSPGRARDPRGASSANQELIDSVFAQLDTEAGGPLVAPRRGTEL